MIARRALLASTAVLAANKANAAAYLVFLPALAPVACRQYTMFDSRFTDTTNNSLNSRMQCVAPVTLVGLTLAFPGFGLNNPETVLPTGFTATTAIEYPQGTFYPVTKSGARSLTVTPGETLTAYDFCPVVIPAGATFWIKTWATWSVGNFWLGDNVASWLPNEWTTLGTDVADNTLNTTVLSTTNVGSGFGPIVFGAVANPTKRLGIIGDSISYGFAEQPTLADNSRFIERAMLDQIPVVNLSRGQDSFAFYLQENVGRHLILDGNVSSLVINYGYNDIWGTNSTAAQCESWLQQVAAPYLAKGIKVWAATVLPRTTSIDGYATVLGQTVNGSSAETQRQTFNAWLLANFASIGLSGVLDFASAIQAPGNSSLWNADGSAGTGSAGFSTLSGGATSSVARAIYKSGNSSGGSGYPLSASIACTVRGYPGETGMLPSVSSTSNGSGVVTTFSVNSAGSLLLNPPMVAANGAWTPDGTHPNPRGCNECIFQTGLGPAMFA